MTGFPLCADDFVRERREVDLHFLSAAREAMLAYWTALLTSIRFTEDPANGCPQESCVLVPGGSMPSATRGELPSTIDLKSGSSG